MPLRKEMCRSMKLYIHHRKKMQCTKLHHHFMSFFLTAWHIVLHSSMRVASLALQPQLVELWKCRAQHLRQFHCAQKHKQKGTPIVSYDVWYFPMVLTLWLIVMSYIVLSALKNGVTYEMDEDLAESRFYEMMSLCFPMVLLWWRCAVDESHEQSKSRHYNSMHCYSNCVMCSHHLLRNGTVQTNIWSNNVPVTMIVLPLKHKCSQKRVIKYIIPRQNGPPKVIHQLLMLAGDIELNPGPLETNSGVSSVLDKKIDQSDYEKIQDYLKELKKEDIVKVGLSLGLNYVQLCDLPPTSAILDMIHIWRLKNSDSTLRALVIALKKNSFNGIAETIERENEGVNSEENSSQQDAETTTAQQMQSLDKIQHSSQDVGSQISPYHLSTKESVTSSGESKRVSFKEQSGSEILVDHCLNTQESIASSGSVSPNDIQGEEHESFKPWPVRPGHPQKSFLAQLEQETEDIMIHFNDFFHEFKASFLLREQQHEISFEDLSDAAQQLFDFEDEDLEPSKSTSKKLLSKILRHQSYVNFDLLLSVIRACGTPQDREEAERYKKAFKQYAKRRTFESNSEVLGSIPKHETVMFILDENQHLFKLIRAHKFKIKLCKLLDIHRYDIVLHKIKQGCIIIVFQIRPKCINVFRSIPLFYDKIISLKKESTLSYKLGDEEVNLNCWKVLESRTVMHSVSKRIKQVSINGREYLSLRYSKTFTDVQKADVGYVKYLNIFVNGQYKDLPIVKGVYYHPPRQSQNKTTYHYPTIVIEKLKFLKEVLSKQEISLVNQISLLLDISCTVFDFESDQSLRITIYPDSIFLQEGSDEDFIARFCPLYNYTFYNKKALQASQSFNLSEPLPLSELQWMEDIVKFIHFQGKNLDNKLPESHILKKMFDQKWISKEDRLRPTSFKSLCEELRHLLETEKTWMGLVASVNDDLVNDEVQIHLILIGDTGVGKTSLRKHLKNEPIDMSEPPTIVMEPEVLYRESLELSSTSVPFQSIINAWKSSSRKIFLTMWDTGGQPIFQDLLPCFARLKCMYGIVIRLPDLQKFDDTPDIRPCNEFSEIVKSPFTNKDIVYRNLAYVQAFSCTLRDDLPDAQRNDGSNVSYPATVIVGTCKDVIIHSNQCLIDMKKDELEEYVRAFVNNHPVSLYSADTCFIHEIDNTLSGNAHKVDDGIRHLRNTISRCAQNSSSKMHKSWKTFEVKLQRLCYTSHINLGIISLTDAIAIGKECNVKNPLAALMYFHELGTFMWYHLSARANMKKFVVIDPKALLEVLAKLFCYNPHSLTPNSKQLIEKGIVTIDYFRTLLKQKASNIDDSWFMDFLEEHHLNVKVILPGKNVVCFFLPSLLATKPDYQHNLAVATSDKASPLYIVPKSGYVATGMFTRLLTALAGVTYGSTVWRIPLNDGQLKNVCRNQFEFIVNECVHIILSEFSKYIRIDCLQFKDSVISKDLYFRIAFTLDVQLQRIVPRWIENKGFDITLKCENETCSSSDTHFLLLENFLLELNTDTSKCSEKQECSLRPSQMIWFGKNTIPPADKSDLFERSLQQGILNMSIASVLFTGLNNSSCANAKNVVCQEPIISELQLTRRVCHDMYFRPHGHSELTKLQPRNYKEAVLYSVGEKAREVMPSSENVSKPKVRPDDQKLLYGDTLRQSKLASSEVIPIQLPQLPSEIIPNMQRPQQVESPAPAAEKMSLATPNKVESPAKKLLETVNVTSLPNDNTSSNDGFLFESESPPRKQLHEDEAAVTSLLNEAASNEFIINGMAHYKNHGKIELVHTFRCRSYICIKEIFKIFVKNVSLSVLVTSTSKRLDAKELNILEENSKFAQKGIVIGSSAIWQSNRMVKNRLLGQFSKFLISSQPNDYIFSINYEQPQDQDWKTGAEILNLAFNLAPSKSYPFSWYFFGFKLHHFMISNNVHAIRVSKHCMVIAKALNMNKETVTAALEHLTDSNMVLYFGDILSDTVFANADIFLHIFSELSDIFYSGNVGAAKPPTMITAAKLCDVLEPCVEKCMPTSDFIVLFRKLLIMAPYDSEHFIIPSFLPLLNDHERKKACTDDSNIEPLYFECPSSGYELISMLQVFLLTLPTEKWKLLKDNSGNPVCLHKNCTKFFNTEINCIVTVGISGQYIEIYLNRFHDTQKNFSCVSTTILHGLEAIKLILNQYQSYDFGISFECSCKRGSRQFHTASFDQKLDKLICKKSGQLPISDLQRRWLKSDGYVQRYLTVNEIVSHLKSMAGKWIEVAASLNVPTDIIGSILVSRLQNDEASLRRVIVWWFKNTPNPEWSAIERVLKRQTATSVSAVHSPATHVPWMARAYSRDMFGLHYEICDFYEYTKPQPPDFELRREIIARTVGVIKKRWPNAKVRYFGSFCTGLFLPSGDVDLVIFLKGISLDHLVDNLKSIALENSILLLNQSSYPIIKFTDKLTRIKVDITINQDSGIKNTKVIEGFMKTYPYLPKLVFVLKQFLYQRNLHDVFYGGISSFILILLLVSFLQQYPHRFFIANPNLGKLLISFFEFYGTKFSFENKGISVLSGGSCFSKKDRLPALEKGDHSQLYIVDPSYPNKNAARACFGVPEIKQVFSQAWFRLHERVVIMRNVTKRMESNLNVILKEVDVKQKADNTIPFSPDQPSVASTQDVDTHHLGVTQSPVHHHPLQKFTNLPRKSSTT